MTMREKKRILAAYKAALLKVFRGAVDAATVDAALYLGDEDPGGWAPDAPLVIHTEKGLPDRESVSGIEAWVRVDDEANARLAKHGLRVFSEPINMAVTAVWKV